MIAQHHHYGATTCSFAASLIRDMISSKSLTTSQMAEAAGCSKRSIIAISANLRMFGNVRVALDPRRPSTHHFTRYA
jgi:DNA-binding XRE family transcriptional regulator